MPIQVIHWYDNGALSKNGTNSSLPDLSVSNLVVPNNPQVGTTYPVTYKVTNSGSANAGSFVVLLMDGTISIGQQTITSLASGQSTTYHSTGHQQQPDQELLTPQQT